MKYEEKNGGRNLKISHRKENKIYSGFKVLNLKDANGNTSGNTHGTSEFLDVRFYCTGETCYCCFWLNKGNVRINSSGKTSGAGYEKTRAALWDALINAGFSEFCEESKAGIVEDLIKYFGVKKYVKVDFYG